MKKFLSLLAALSLLTLPMTALAAPGDALLLRADAQCGVDLRGLVEADGTVYMFTYHDEVYTLAPGADTPERRAFQTPQPEMEDEETTLYPDIAAYIAYEGRPCVVLTEMLEETEGEGEDAEYFRTCEGAWLCELEFDAEGNASVGEEITELDWFDIIQGTDYEYYAQCDRPFVAGDLLCFTSYDESGNNIIVTTDLTDGDTEIYYPTDLGLGAYVEEICAYKDGLLLALSVQYTQDGNIANLYRTDPEAEEAELLAEVPLTGRGYPDGLVYRADNDTLYFAMNGELWALPGMDAERLESVASLPVEASYDVRPILTSEGYYITGSYEAVVRRNTDPALRSDVRLTVQRNYNPSINNAYYAFSAEYGDVDVVMVEQVEDVVQAMMNRSSDVDIYCLSVDSAEYEAVYSRGYMAELTESEELSAFIDSLYPFAREACVKDGELLGVPVEFYVDSMGYDPEAFARLGLTEEDVPTTWQAFFESLEPLAAKVAEVEGMTLFDGFEDYGSARYMLLDTMIASYMAYISQPGSELAFDTVAFRGALNACEAVDWTALGLAEPEDMNGYSWTSSSGESTHDALFSSYGNPTAETYAVQGSFQPLPLGFDGSRQLSAQMTVAFVNPFSQHREEAVAFLEAVAREMEPLLKIQLCPEENEPVKNPSYDTMLAAYDQMIADAQAQLDAAETEAEKQAYAAILAEYEKVRADFLRYGAWQASEESIARYRAFAPQIIVIRNLGMGGDNASAFYELQNQFTQGLITADEFIEGVDGKLQMMMLEGM
ncbi:MAG TPA: carbohydrate ABC transporter substrate-binding protein [Candidatus Pullichristensenella excrementipullorum]|nr:carbohydrate ABC transporter substrate-binding protein [Candidatus Pullichristensenella excrementipullorum]